MATMCGAEIVLAAPPSVTRNGTGLSLKNGSRWWSVKHAGSTETIASSMLSSRGTPAAFSRPIKSEISFIRTPLYQPFGRRGFEHNACPLS